MKNSAKVTIFVHKDLHAVLIEVRGLICYNDRSDDWTGRFYMKIVELLKKYFGYDSFRTGQESLVESILQGRDTFGIMPTGAGKSICYQVPALAMEGITLVISPLISLMKDQVSSLNEAGIHAAYINSSLTAGQTQLALQRARNGQYKIIYVAPERLETEDFLDFAQNTEIAMVTVDEAHCISQWGQDFRPSYLKIIDFIKRLPVRPVISAFTATATEHVREDIICILGLKKPNVVITGFDRKNLYFEVMAIRKKDPFILEYVEKHSSNSGIIYCATRKGVEELYELLLAQGLGVTKYHAGLGNTERERNQEDFLYDRKPVMIATNAFGMGIDKSNVRYVIHYNMPKNMESYYQEAGRAGRDGEAADCILLYAPKDIMLNQYMIEHGVENETLSWEEQEAVRERDRERLNQIVSYCTTRNCLREYMLRYFGEYGSGSCGNCSNCLTEYEEEDVTEISREIITCILECKQRYGINVIVATLRGMKQAKLVSYGLTDLSSYGKQSEIGETKLKQIINEMINSEILLVTPDKYALLKLTSKAKEILEGKTRVLVKCSKETEEELPVGRKKKPRTSELLTSSGMRLFDELRELRLVIAREEGMPPYIIFSDKTLVDMCVKAPATKEEMLTVNGVGDNKLERFGERFLTKISEFIGEDKNSLSFDTELEPNKDSLKSSTGKKSQRKVEFQMTSELAKKVEYQENATLGELVAKINDLRDETVMKRLTAVSIMDWLTREGYLEIISQGEKNDIRKVLEPGIELGIHIENKVSERGTSYQVMWVTENAQRFIVQSLLERG